MTKVLLRYMHLGWLKSICAQSILDSNNAKFVAIFNVNDSITNLIRSYPKDTMISAVTHKSLLKRL